MNEIRQLCTTGSSPDKHLDEILALFHACPPQHLLPSLSLICQSISCMSIEQLNINIINHSIFILIRKWSERLFHLWLNNGTLNGDEYRAIFYIHQLFKLLSEWLIEQDNIIFNTKNNEILEFEHIIENLFLYENFLQTLSQVINQLINNENEKSFNIIINQISDEEDHISFDDIHLQTQNSDIQTEQSDVLDVLYRCVNTLVILYSHRNLINNPLIEQYLTPCIINCLNSSLFIQLSIEFLRENLTRDKINICSIFFLFTCLDYCLLSKKTISIIKIIPSINKIFHIGYEISKYTNDESTLLIIRLIRLINQIALINNEAIIQENFFHFLLPYFEILCQTSNLINDLNLLIITICSTIIGKQYLRQFNFIQYILHEVKHNFQFWYPLGILLTQNDLNQISFFKRLIYLLGQRSMNIFQSLTTASNDTSFDSISFSSKNQIILTAIDWFTLLRTYFLSFSIIVNELINSTKKNHLIPILIDTILSNEENDDITSKLIDIMIEILLTCILNTSKNFHNNLQKHNDLNQWLQINNNNNLSSQIIFSILNPKISLRSSFSSNILICICNVNESYDELCITIRDRLQLFDEQYLIEFFLTSNCQSIDTLIQLINHSSICIFCVNKQMKNDNISHFIYYYLSNQTIKIPLLKILLESELELNGNWLDNIPIIDLQIIYKEISQYLKQIETNHLTNNFMERSVCYWSTNDVIQWCKTTQNNFESLRPLIMRLNGQGLVHLAEILSIEPASMYHSLNEELYQRTGSTVPLTEYVSLRSELQQLILKKSKQSLTKKSNGLITKKRRFKNSRFCTLF